MEGEDEESDEPRAFQRAAVWKRIIVTAAGAVMNLALGFIVLLIVVCLQGQIVSRTVYGFQENAASQQKRPAAGRHYRGGERQALLYRKRYQL